MCSNGSKPHVANSSTLPKFLHSLRKISEENNFDFGTSREYSQFSLINQEQAIKIKKKVDGKGCLRTAEWVKTIIKQ